MTNVIFLFDTPKQILVSEIENFRQFRTPRCITYDNNQRQNDNKAWTASNFLKLTEVDVPLFMLPIVRIEIFVISSC
jgi:hypothetical protein